MIRRRRKRGRGASSVADGENEETHGSPRPRKRGKREQGPADEKSFDLREHARQMGILNAVPSPFSAEQSEEFQQLVENYKAHTLAVIAHNDTLAKEEDRAHPTGRTFGLGKKYFHPEHKKYCVILRKNGMDAYGIRQKKLSTNRAGQVYIGKRGFLIYRFGWECVFGKIPGGFEIDHVDENRKNDRIENLQCVPGIQNQRRSKCGRTKTPAMRAKLSQPLIGLDAETGILRKFRSSQEASRQTGLNQGHISRNAKKNRGKTRANLRSLGKKMAFWPDPDFVSKPHEDEKLETNDMTIGMLVAKGRLSRKWAEKVRISDKGRVLTARGKLVVPALAASGSERRRYANTDVAHLVFSVYHPTEWAKYVTLRGAGQNVAICHKNTELDSEGALSNAADNLYLGTTGENCDQRWDDATKKDKPRVRVTIVKTGKVRFFRSAARAKKDLRLTYACSTIRKYARLGRAYGDHEFGLDYSLCAKTRWDDATKKDKPRVRVTIVKTGKVRFFRSAARAKKDLRLTYACKTIRKYARLGRAYGDHEFGLDYSLCAKTKKAT